MTLYVSILSVAAVVAAAAACVGRVAFPGDLDGPYPHRPLAGPPRMAGCPGRKASAWMKRMPRSPKRTREGWSSGTCCGERMRTAAIQGWQLAGLSLGLNAYAGDRNDGDLREKLRGALGSHELVVNYLEQENPGTWEVDRMLLDYAVLEAGCGVEERLVEKSLAFLESLKTEAGTLAYRRGQPAVRYVDTIGLACPLAAACAARTGREEDWNLAARQVEEYDAALLAGSSFPAHGFEMDRGYPLGLYDWSRGIGWYALGLCELYRLMEAHGRPEAGAMAKRIVSLSRELLPLRKRNGGFGWMVARPESVFESSGTALMGLLMLTAYHISGESCFLDAAFGAEKALMGVTRRSGALDMCQGDTKGIGMYSDVWGLMPFAQGMALRLSVELNKEEGEG